MFTKRKNKIIYISVISYILLYFLLIIRVLSKYTSLTNTVFLLTLGISSIILYGFKRFELTKINKKVTILVFVSLIIYFTIIYILGLFTGYGRSIYSTNLISILKNIILPLISVISLEIVRYSFISANKDSKNRVFIITLLLIILDIIINFYYFELNLNNLFIFLTVSVLPIIFKNIFLSYMDYKIGYYPNIIYVVTICLYKYIIPYKPMLGNYLTSVVNIALPSLLYIYSSRMISNYLNGKYKNIKMFFKAILIDMPLFISFTIFIGLISGFFKYHLIGVDTSEIKPIINVGDAVLINQKYNYDSYKKGDIFVYKDGKKIIIDRITKVKNNNVVKNKIYITKEKTKGKKDTYKYIPNKNILGKYENFKISKIAKPTIWFKKLIR